MTWLLLLCIAYVQPLQCLPDVSPSLFPEFRLRRDPSYSVQPSVWPVSSLLKRSYDTSLHSISRYSATSSICLPAPGIGSKALCIAGEFFFLIVCAPVLRTTVVLVLRFLEIRDALGGLEGSDWLGRMASEPHGPTCPWSPALRFQVHTTTSGFFTCFLEIGLRAACSLVDIYLLITSPFADVSYQSMFNHLHLVWRAP